MTHDRKNSSDIKGALAFVHHESAGGILLLFATLAALALANSPFAELYTSVLHAHLGSHLEPLGLNKSILHWINDGLMTIFFFLVGLEIKRELLFGELSSVQKALFPFVAALGGMILPGLIYVGLNWGNSATLSGWAIPTATDIAFATGILTLFGAGLPSALKVFLLALAIIDDLGAILIIAFFYTADLSLLSLTLAAGGVAVLVLMNVLGVQRLFLYILLGVFVWFCVLKSGVHATLAGVVTAFALPFGRKGVKKETHETDTNEVSPQGLMDLLHPWVTFLILPLFAFANAGVSLSQVTHEILLESVPLGIALGLFFGKPLGILLFTWLMTQLKVAALPESLTWSHILGVGFLAGIGFTMSLFIGNLAFQDALATTEVRLGVLGGSTLSAVTGFLLLSRLTQKGHGA
ncbi:MAG: Na+/H+ antiporter NhaA [Hyphomicrobium sp.]